jgi:hypothetical protein
MIDVRCLPRSVRLCVGLGCVAVSWEGRPRSEAGRNQGLGEWSGGADVVNGAFVGMTRHALS